MGGKSGGGYNADAMLEHGDKSLALQREMYDDSQDRTQPFYEGGLSAFNMLLDGIGASGGNVKSRDQLMNSMRDNYTTTENNNMGDMYRSSDGRMLTRDESMLEAGINPKANGADRYGDDYLNQKGFNLYSPAQKSNVDFEGLNSAVDARMAEQGTPDGFGGLLEKFDMDKFQADPGYQFRLDEQNKAIERSAAARGEYYDPKTMMALQERGGNLADQTYGAAYDRYNNDQNTVFNRLASIAGVGQTANSSLNQSGSNYANQASNIYGQMGSAVTEANAANAAAPSMFSSLLNAGTQLGSAAIFASDERLKENIVKDGVENGYQMYQFNYINVPDKTYRGVMAQDVESLKPEAVTESGGFKKVDYGMLGISMTEVK